MMPSQEQTIMILGAQSSVGKSVVEQLIPFGHKIVGTYRREVPMNGNFEKVDWRHLDLANFESISDIVAWAESSTYDVVLNLIGQLSNLPINASLGDVRMYFDTYVNNQTFLIRELLNAKGKRQVLFVNLSSRAVTYGSHDLYYSEAKSAIHALTKSLAKIHRESYFINIVAGLIKGSAMYLSMPKEVQIDHIRRAGGRLMEIDDLGKLIVDLICKTESKMSKTLHGYFDLMAGPQYE